MLQNAYFLAKIGADTAENEQHFAVARESPLRKRSPVIPFGGCPLDPRALGWLSTADETLREKEA